jgi:hypothetical protein
VTELVDKAQVLQRFRYPELAVPFLPSLSAELRRKDEGSGRKYLDGMQRQALVMQETTAFAL